MNELSKLNLVDRCWMMRGFGSFEISINLVERTSSATKNEEENWTEKQLVRTTEWIINLRLKKFENLFLVCVIKKARKQRRYELRHGLRLFVVRSGNQRSGNERVNKQFPCKCSRLNLTASRMATVSSPLIYYKFWNLYTLFPVSGAPKQDACSQAIVETPEGQISDKEREKVSPVYKNGNL
jgi:hypothetical protein